MKGSEWGSAGSYRRRHHRWHRRLARWIEDRTGVLVWQWILILLVLGLVPFVIFVVEGLGR